MCFLKAIAPRDFWKNQHLGGLHDFCNGGSHLVPRNIQTEKGVR